MNTDKTVVQRGTDVKFTVSFLNPDGNGVTDLVVENVIAKFINRTKLDEYNSHCKKECDRRYPIEPTSFDYDSEAYCLNQSGKSCYNVMPIQSCKKCNIPLCSFESFGRVRYDSSSNKFHVLFPAESQIFDGEYDLVLTASIYYPAYKDNDTKKLSITYDKIVELVESAIELPNPIQAITITTQ